MTLYPKMSTGIGLITPTMWSRMMRSLEHFENEQQSRSEDLSPESLNSRITDLEMHKPFFFAKLLRARVLDIDLYNPNTYEYAWVEVKPVTDAVDCCRVCLNSRHCAYGDDTCEWDNTFCCNIDYCTAFLEYQGHWNWWEDTVNTSWGDTLPEDGFDLYDLKSHYNPEGYPCIYGSCVTVNPDGLGYPNINSVAYTNPAMNILEAFNTGYNAGGVDQIKGVGDFMMQAIGGGDTQYDGEPIGENDPTLPQCWDADLNQPPCTQFEFPLKTTPIVLMYNIRETDGTFRQVFQEANSYDGTCVSC
jgi:hypothetical protein